MKIRSGTRQPLGEERFWILDGREGRNAEAGRARRKTLRRVSEAGGRSFGEIGRDGALTLAGVFAFVGFRVFRGFLDRGVLAAKRHRERKRGGGGKTEIGKMKRNAEAGRLQRKTLSWILKVWSADFSRRLWFEFCDFQHSLGMLRL